MAMHFLVQVHAIFLLVFLVYGASSCEQEEYWQMKLPKVPMPQAIKDDLFHSKAIEEFKPFTIETNTKKASMKQPYTVGAWKYNSDSDNNVVVEKAIDMKQPYTVGAWKYNEIIEPLASTKQPYTVGAWKYNADNVADQKIAEPLVSMKQPYTVGAWKYNVAEKQEVADIKQPYTVGAWKYNAENVADQKIEKPLANTKQPYTVGAWKYNVAEKQEVADIKQPYTVGAWKYNAENVADQKIEKPLANTKQPYIVGAWKYDVAEKQEVADIKQPYTVGAWKYNTENVADQKIAKPLASMKQPYTVGAWKYNVVEKQGVADIKQPYTVGAWKYNTENVADQKIAKPLASIKQPYTVGAWKYGADNVAMKQPYTVGAWKYNNAVEKQVADIKQPYTVGAWKYNAESHDHPQHLIRNEEDLSYGSVFFVEKSLRLGMKLKHDFQKTPKAPFLPKNIAKTMPFSEDKFTEILNLFSLKSESPQAAGIQGTLDACLHRPKVKKENRTCAQSMEDVVDFVVGELGTNDVELRMMKREIKVVNGIQDYVITKVNKLDVPGNTAVACHRMNYPYVVYYCHHQKDIGHYDVTLVSPTTGAAIQTTAVCHYDTYAWQPDVPALRYLGIKPGDAPVCHFSAVNDMFWTLNPNTKFLKMVY